MTCEFTIDGVIYRLTISRNNRIYLAIIGGASPAYRPEYDPFDWDYVPSVTTDIGCSRYPVTVLRTAYRQLVHWVGETRPPFFIFSAETEKRRRLYRRVAADLAKRFPYELVEVGSTFYFYRRNPNWEAA